ncbi:SchA/CurD-like domain-containing protein [Streptomyces rubellomurinus]|uniref:Protein in whiE locus n=2 Tax=Streptomyces TaxID=1883 RepID=A0A0F2THI1_STRR3|nr:SchA/CurD-like domain-containing protein [Streptomyces rubellomurinus]KJS56996.1 protein in whiE locus [Streptomyces rubellomurinus subsp. indigoferus]KJS62644.1 protein in whiE locus [Streptomyces rubellomurinus]
MTTLSEPQRKQPSDDNDSRLRVVLMLEIQDGAQQRFLDVYEQLRHQVASVPGHVSDQLCQSINDPRQWLITSEWRDQETFLEWVDSPAHREMVKPMHGCVSDNFRSLRYAVLRETSAAGSTGTRAPMEVPPGLPRTEPAAGQAGPPKADPGPDGVVRHALTFTVKPGSEPEVARILSGYASPKAEVDEHTRLRRTSLFLHGNRVVRAVEVEGSLGDALRHVAMQPEVRAVEEALNPHLEEARQLGDPQSARAFFAKAALPARHQAIASAPCSGRLHRHAVLYPVRPGCGPAVAELLATYDNLATADPTGPVAASTVFHRDDVVVRLVDLRVPAEADPVAALGVAGEREAAALGALLDLGPHGDLRTVAGLSALLAARAMSPLTDRSAQES